MMTSISLSTHLASANAVSSIFLMSLYSSSCIFGRYDGTGTTGNPNLVCISCGWTPWYSNVGASLTRCDHLQSDH